MELGEVALQFEALWFGGILCAIGVAFFLVWIFVLIWVYRDAESRGMNGVLWIILVFFLSWIGLLVYLVVRGGHPPRTGAWPPAPGTYPPPGYPPPPVAYAPPPSGYAPPPIGYPPSTAPPPPSPGVCRQCGTPLPAGAVFCASCGARQ